MIAVVEQINDSSVDFIVEETGFWFQLPKNFVKGIKEGSRIKFELTEMPKVEDDSSFEEVGGFIKNPPKQELI